MGRVIEIVKNQTIRKYYLLKLLLNKEQGYLFRSGWIKSFRQKAPVEVGGAPIPWLSLPAVYFLKNGRLNKDLTVFEFGSGNSTLFFSKRVKQVFSAEHDKAWKDYLQPKLPGNATLLFCPLDDEDKYEKSILETGVKFDLVLIDGRKRVACIKHSFEALTDQGVIIFDDSDREKYQEGLEMAKQNGFKRLDFWGMAAGSIREKDTTILYRENNCLGI